MGQVYLRKRGCQARGQVRLPAGHGQAVRAQRGLELRDRELCGRRVGLRLWRAVALEHLQGVRGDHQQTQ